MNLSVIKHPNVERQTKKGSPLPQASHHAVQDGVRDERKNEGGIRDDKTFSGGMWDKKFSPGTGFAHFDRWDAG